MIPEMRNVKKITVDVNHNAKTRRLLKALDNRADFRRVTDVYFSRDEAQIEHIAITGIDELNFAIDISLFKCFSYVDKYRLMAFKAPLMLIYSSLRSLQTSYSTSPLRKNFHICPILDACGKTLTSLDTSVYVNSHDDIASYHCCCWLSA